MAVPVASQGRLPRYRESHGIDILAAKLRSISMIAEQIADKLAALHPEVLDIVNESHMHSGPATDSHFKVVIVSAAFDGLRPVARHQKVYGLLSAELAGPVHALSVHAYTPSEFDPQAVPLSPNCRGGSKVG